MIDEKWRENDGLVNTFSARAPIGEPQQEIDYKGNLQQSTGTAQQTTGSASRSTGSSQLQAGCNVQETKSSSGKIQQGTITPGIWNILPTFDGDHMSLQGGLTKQRDVKEFYLNLLQMVSSL